MVDNDYILLYNELKEKYSFLELSDDIYKELFEKHLILLKQEKKIRADKIKNYFRKTFYITIYEYAKELYDIKTLISKYINSNVSLRKTKEENELELKKLASFFDKIGQDADIYAFNEIMDDNSPIYDICSMILNNYETIERSKLESISNNIYISAMLESFCLKSHIKIKENFSAFEDDIDFQNFDDIKENDSDSYNQFKMYMKEINKIPLLTSDEEFDYAIRIKKGDNYIKNKFIESNLRLVVFIALKYRYSGMPIMDLIQEGNMGMMKAVDKFDPYRGCKFSTYASFWIRESITRAIENQSRIIKVPIYKIAKYNSIMDMKTNSFQELGRDMSYEEIAGKMNISMKKLNSILSSFKEITSLDKPICDGDSSMLIEEVVPNNDIEIEDKYLYSDFLNRVRELLELPELNDRERLVLKLRFGFLNDKLYSLDEISHILCVKKERVRQVEAIALHKLRKEKKTEYLTIYMDNQTLALNNLEEAKKIKKLKDIYKNGRIGETKTISNFEKIKKYSESQCEQVIQTLTEEERKIYYKYLGNEKNNTVDKSSPEYKRLRNNILPKVMRRLESKSKKIIVFDNTQTERKCEDFNSRVLVKRYK